MSAPSAAATPNPADYRQIAEQTNLGQRGRAGMQALGAIQVAAYHRLRSAARHAFYETPEATALVADHNAARDTSSSSKTALRDRLNKATALAETLPLHRMERFLQRYIAEENWRRGIITVEAKRRQFETFVVAPKNAETSVPRGTIQLDPDLPLPRFFSEVEFHLQPGGWEGYDLYGPVLSYAIYPHVFARGGFASMPATAGATGYRPRIIGMLPKADYGRIMDMGCGSGSTTRWLSQSFPEAEITACDLSAVQLKAGFAIAEKAGMTIHFKQRDARDTREPSDSFDLVVHNAVAHEMPTKANLDVFAEIFRILKPGGDFLMMDPPPFRDVDLFSAVLLDWETEHRNEPFFSTAMLQDWPAELAAIGFEVRHTEIVDNTFPWVLVATKPI